MNSIGKIDIVPQDIGRVLLNLINNAFYAVPQKPLTERLARQSGDGGQSVRTNGFNKHKKI